MNWITDFLKGRIRVVVEGHDSDLSRALSGIPQGIILTPQFFICYVNDITALVKSKLRLYADDMFSYIDIYLHRNTLKYCKKRLIRY